MYICVGAQPIPYLLLHTPIYSRMRPTTRSKRGDLSLIALSLSVLSLFLARALLAREPAARARGIKYNKDIQWELIGYLPIYRSLSAHCCVVPPAQRRCTGPMPWCRDAVPERAHPSCFFFHSPFLFSVPLLCFFFFHRRRPNRDIPWWNNIADHVFSGRNASPRSRYRCAASASRRRTPAFSTRHPVPGECLTNPYPYASLAMWLFPGSWNVARFDTLRRRGVSSLDLWIYFAAFAPSVLFN